MVYGNQNMGKKISVIIPTYYRNDLVRDAIESVLQQDYEPVELIVVDDSGEGNAEPVLREYDDVRAIIRDENGDQEQAYMTGIEVSTGDYIHFLDDDDLLLEGNLSKTAEVLEEDPDVGVAYCGVKRGEEQFYPKPEVSGNILEPALRLDVFPCYTCSMLIERDILMDTMPLPYVDLSLMIELAQRTEFDYVNKCLTRYRTEESRKWVGTSRFESVRQVFREQKDVYDQYPAIRNDVFSNYYEREARARLEQRLWSSRAILAFSKAMYYTDTRRFRCGAQFVASLFGRPGLKTLVGTQEVLSN